MILALCFAVTACAFFVIGSAYEACRRGGSLALLAECDRLADVIDLRQQWEDSA